MDNLWNQSFDNLHSIGSKPSIYYIKPGLHKDYKIKTKQCLCFQRQFRYYSPVYDGYYETWDFVMF